MRILKLINGFVTNSSSSSAPVILAGKKGKKLEDLFNELGISSGLTYHFRKDEGVINRYKLEVNDLKESYEFYIAYICLYDWGDGDLWEDEDGWDPSDGPIERDDELTGKLDLFNDRKSRENLVKDDLILLYVGIAD